MRTIQRLTTLLVLLLTVAAAAPAGQDKGRDDAYEDEMTKGQQALNRRQFEPALQSFKKAYGLKDKTSLNALLGMLMAYRGLGANKNVVDLIDDGLKLAGDDKRQQAALYNVRGAALVALADKANDKRLLDAEQAFRAALAANAELYSAQLNLGVALLKQGHDEDGVRELKAYVERAPKGPETANALKMIDDPRRAREPFAPDFSLTTKQGEFLALDDLKGKTVVLDFWGTWCKPCLMATPGLVKLNRKFSEQGVVFIGVAVNDQEDSWSAYVDKNKMEWPQFFDKTRKMSTPFGVTAFPTYIVIDGDGIVRARKAGYGPDTDGWLEDQIKRTLKKR